MDIRAPLFTLAELCRATGLPRSAANMWLRRGQISPTRSERLAVRKRSLFSVQAIFEVKLMHVLAEHLDLGPSASEAPASEIAESLWSVARESDRGRTLSLLAAVTKVEGRWRTVGPELDAGKFSDKFPVGVPYAVIPVGEIFASVYRACQDIYEGNEPAEPKKVRRARS